ncbi:hypothetical protein MJG53_007035 [Ovis ammon polii x Ovis aries]|uniref:Uncharacterized protein n=1 Tax=Ovis ammon polii x Ovis aries TaxID=2918886 RepID=A0ACB9V1J0_9CETA|nr:hypothetical protein MJG53_007035 [Ovis ammon polii x Ovis aries]
MSETEVDDQKGLPGGDGQNWTLKDRKRERETANHTGLALVHGCTDVVIQKQRWPLLSESVDDFLKVKVKTKTLDFIDVLLLTKDEDGKGLSDEDI